MTLTRQIVTSRAAAAATVTTFPKKNYFRIGFLYLTIYSIHSTTTAKSYKFSTQDEQLKNINKKKTPTEAKWNNHNLCTATIFNNFIAANRIVSHAAYWKLFRLTHSGKRTRAWCTWRVHRPQNHGDAAAFVWTMDRSFFLLSFLSTVNYHPLFWCMRV